MLSPLMIRWWWPVLLSIVPAGFTPMPVTANLTLNGLLTTAPSFGSLKSTDCAAAAPATRAIARAAIIFFISLSSFEWWSNVLDDQAFRADCPSRAGHRKANGVQFRFLFDNCPAFAA